jgi:homogentisate phytyltransferase/homogentisate geranylgeranyltransferase
MTHIQNFLRFSRPHTIIGTTISIGTLYLLALSLSDFEQLHLETLGWTLLSCLGANIYIVGLNQITDIEIDKINKPYLPLASGAYTLRLAYIIIIISVILSLVIAFLVGPYLLATVVLSLILGTAYSVEPFRLKRFYFWAAFCIIAVRSFIVNLLLFLNFHHIINGQTSIPFIVWLLTGTILVYSIVIAWFKDLPDVEGDEKYEVNTLPIRLGIQRVFRIGVGLVIMTYVVLMLSTIFAELPVQQVVFGVSHLLLLLFFCWASWRVQLKQQKSIQRYYQVIWVLFFLEYFSFAFAGLAA